MKGYKIRKMNYSCNFQGAIQINWQILPWEMLTLHATDHEINGGVPLTVKRTHNGAIMMYTLLGILNCVFLPVFQWNQ